MHSISNCAVKSLDDDALRTPRLKRGAVDCVFYDFHNAKVRSNQAVVDAATLFSNIISAHKMLPLRCIPVDNAFAAVDAFAHTSACGLGGWWCPPGATPSPSSVSWLSIRLETLDLPPWLRCSSLQSLIACFEALAQLLLLLGSPACHAAW